MESLLNLAVVLLQSTVPIAREISQMADTTKDQTVLIFIILTGYGPVATGFGVLWRKLNKAQEEIKRLSSESQSKLVEHFNEKQALINQHHHEKQMLMIENNKTSGQLEAVLSKLDKLNP